MVFKSEIFKSLSFFYNKCRSVILDSGEISEWLTSKLEVNFSCSMLFSKESVKILDFFHKAQNHRYC